MMDATVVIVKGHIQSIGPGPAHAPQGTLIDLKGRWLLPGFVDAHTHVGDLAEAHRALRSGATTVGEAGVNHFADIGMRELNHKGVVDVPDIVAAGYHVRTHPADDYFLWPARMAMKVLRQPSVQVCTQLSTAPISAMPLCA